MDPRTLATFEASLARCSQDPAFLDRFYKRFLEASPAVREKFARTDFAHQKRALRSSFDLLLLAAREGDPAAYLEGLAERHDAAHLNVGAAFYDLWLDSLLECVRVSDPRCDAEVEAGWEAVMGVGIRFMVSRYPGTPRS